MPGMEITEMSQELKWCLRSKLPSGAPVGRWPQAKARDANNPDS